MRDAATLTSSPAGKTVFLPSEAMRTRGTSSRIELALLPATRFRDWVERSPSIRSHVIFLLAAHTSRLVDLIETLLLPLDRHLAGILLRGRGANTNLLATHVALAADAATSREVASRYLKDFEQIGAVHLGLSSYEIDRSSRRSENGITHRRREDHHLATDRS